MKTPLLKVASCSIFGVAQNHATKITSVGPRLRQACFFVVLFALVKKEAKNGIKIFAEMCQIWQLLFQFLIPDFKDKYF